MPENSTLYICYFGLREPLVQTQVLAYLKELREIDALHITLLTFEPNMRARWSPAEIEEEKKKLAAQGIRWEMLPYHKRFSVLATAYDVMRGAWFVFSLLRKEPIDILHCRVHIPALMGALGRKFSRRKPKLLFDIRGFMPEEYTDAGIWPEGGWLFRVAKRVEKWLIREADGFVVLTEKARDILFPGSIATGADELGRPVEVIPCCVDFSRFGGLDKKERDKQRARLGVTDRFVITYVGSFGGWYLTEPMLQFFKAARTQDPNTFVIILTQREAGIVEKLTGMGFGEGDFFIGKVAPEEVPEYLIASDAAISFIKACYSKQSSSPTKIAEYLACGLPIIANRGVGDIDQLIEYNHLGVLIDDFETGSFHEAIEKLKELGNIEQRCRAAAGEYFDLSIVGGEKYRRLYTRLLPGRE